MEDYPASLSTPPPTTCNRFTARVNRLIGDLNIASWRQTLTQFSNDFHNRYYTQASGEAAAVWLGNQYQNIIAANRRTDVTVRRFDHAGFRQPSIIVTIPGSQTSELVILGGHLDSTAGSATARSPGADDDGSGSIALLEVFRTLMQNNFRPRFTVELMGFAAEEAGLRGSAGIVQSYTSTPRKEVRGMLQLDMIGYPGQNGNSPAAFITDFTTPVLTTFVRQCAAQYVTSVQWTNSQCGYGCSDHASFSRANYPAAFVFETPFGQHNREIHTVRDTVALLTNNHALHFLKLAVAFAVEMGEDNTA
jgi:leucyl aminopeptidase